VEFCPCHGFSSAEGQGDMKMTARKIDFIVAGAFHPDAPAVNLHNSF
jgi:hypothetical protein